jgi:hypothetical protein
VIVVLAIVVFVWLAYRFPVWEAQGQDLDDDFISPPQYESRLIELDRAAIEKAYMQQITFLFQQWMKDDTDQPRRAKRGINHAKDAYIRGLKQIELREKVR